MKKVYVLLLAGLLSFSSSFAGNTIDNNLTLGFENRKIDLEPYLKGFPYSQFSVSKDGSKLYFFKTGNENRLQWLDLNKTHSLDKATDVTSVDFSRRNGWQPTYNAADGQFYWIGDVSNEEIINIYRTVPGSNKTERLTDVPYIYAWSFNPEGTKIAYVARMGQNEKRLDELHVLDVRTKKDVLVCKDTPAYRFTWGDISWLPDEKGFLLPGLKNMDRRYTNIIHVDSQTGTQTALTDDGRPASLSGCKVLDGWYEDHKGYFLSDKDGYENLYSFDVKTKTVKQVTHYRTDISDAKFVTVGKVRYLLATLENPIETRLIVLDPSTDKVKFEHASPLNLTLAAAKGDHAWFTATSTDRVFQLLNATITPKGIKWKVEVDIPAELKKQLVQSTVERLEIPTFDVDSLTGKKRVLHAYLYKPLKPLPKDKQLVMIESFYGGENRYNSEYQIYADAGIYVLSPSPRGSDGFGRDFAALNDHDLGGNETLDIINTGKYISEKLGIPAERVGVFGMSHGGYETMRLMTFPGEVNHHRDKFPFGFGIEVAGFCDIIWQHTHSNIPDWTSLEAGDPETDYLKLVDRSPITHADKISGPLLLIHGTHDNRVNIGGSRFMAEKLKQLGKPYRYIEFPGLGHGIKGIDNNRKFYKDCFDFLEYFVLKTK